MDNLKYPKKLIQKSDCVLVGDKCLDNENKTESCEGGAIKGKNNLEEKSYIKKTNAEKKCFQRKSRRSSVTKQSNDVEADNNPITSLPSTSSELSNNHSREIHADNTKKGFNESNQYKMSINSNNNKNALRTLHPHVGLHFFPESNKATPVPSSERNLPEITGSCEETRPKPRSKKFSLTVDRFYRDAKMNPPPDKELPGPKSLDPKKNKPENVKEGSNNPQPVKGFSYPDEVWNPPLANPGTMVGFTPAGQRHEVDLNLDRPSWFSSEYAQVQFDDATKINVSKMIREMESGSFVPVQLDADMERNYKAEQELFREKAAEVIKEFAENIDDINPLLDVTEAELEEHNRKLETEDELVKLIQFAMLRAEDFPLQVSEKLKNALNMEFTALMFKKNPVFLDCIEELSTSSNYIEVKQQAQTLLDKIKGLFNVPETQTFEEYFESQVDILKSATEHMSLLELMVLTEEPPNKEPSDDSSNEPKNTSTNNSLQPSEEDKNTVSEDEDEWIPLVNNDVLMVDRITEDEIGSNTIETISSEDQDDGDEYYVSGSESSDESVDVEPDYADESVQFVILDAINGMVFHGYRGYTEIDFFEYI